MFNVFLDHYGILDERHGAAVVDDKPQSILKRDRQTIVIPGCYGVIVESQTEDRPDWSPTLRSSVPAVAKPPAPGTQAEKYLPDLASGSVPH